MPKFVFGASGTLLAQIRAGAPIDLFAAASEKETETLAAAGLVLGKAEVFASNVMAVIVPKGSTVRQVEELGGSFVRRIALSDPKTVPSGRYAQQMLERRGFWETVRKKLIFGTNVRQTLAYVTDGNVDAGIVFRTDALRAGNAVRVIALSIPGKDHPPIRYTVAVLQRSREPERARRFLEFLTTEPGHAILGRYGFAPPEKRVS